MAGAFQRFELAELRLADVEWVNEGLRVNLAAARPARKDLESLYQSPADASCEPRH